MSSTSPFISQHVGGGSLLPPDSRLRKCSVDGGLPLRSLSGSGCCLKGFVCNRHNHCATQARGRCRRYICARVLSIHTRHTHTHTHSLLEICSNPSDFLPSNVTSATRLMRWKEPNDANVLALFFRCVFSFFHSKMKKLISSLTHLNVEIKQKCAFGCETGLQQ